MSTRRSVRFIYLIDGVEPLDVVENRIEEAALGALIATLLSFVQFLFGFVVAEVLCATVPQIMKIVGFRYSELGTKISRCSGTHHVKDVIVPLVRTLKTNSRLLEKVVRYVTADDLTLRVEVNLHKFTETRTVVVALRFRVTEGLKHRISWKI